MSELSVEDIEDFYGRYGSSVLHRCRQLLHEDAAAWDAMHQTFVRAIKYRKSFRAEAQPRTWLFTIATRVCMDELRRRNKHELPSLDDAPEPSDDGEIPKSLEARLEQKRTIARLLAMFSTRVQEVVVLRYFDELEVREISTRTGLSERTVARRLSQFLERSRRILTADA